MKFFRKNKVNTIVQNIKKNEYEPKRTVVEHKKICTIPVYLWKNEFNNINEDTIMKNLLDYDYYNYALEKSYNSIEDCKRWVSDGDTMMHFRIYEAKVEITYEIETVEYSDDDIRRYKEITNIKYLGVCRRVPFEKLGMEKVFINRKNVLITDIGDVNKLHRIRPAVYCRDKYFTMTKNCGLSDEFLKEIYNLRIKPYENNCHSYQIIRSTNDAIRCINEVIAGNKDISREMVVYKIVKELGMA